MRLRALARRPDIDALSDALGIARPVDGRVPVLDRGGRTVALATVDRELLPILLEHSWCLSSAGYPWRHVVHGERARLHHVVLPFVDGFEVDHIAGDLLDARRVALRLVTRREQRANRATASRSRSGYRGVHQRGSRWQARAEIDGRVVHIGTYDDPESADEAAREFRRANMPGADPVLPPPAPVWAGTVLFPTPWPSGGPVPHGQLTFVLDDAAAAPASALTTTS
jgi:hypothetical protein